MNIIEIIRSDKILAEKIVYLCDIEIYPNNQNPRNKNMYGEIIRNINGMAFGCNAAEGEYILLEDNTIGFFSSEWDCGRIAENINELFELLINISCWIDYLYIDLYNDDKMLNQYIIKTEKDNEEYYNEIFNGNNIEKDKYKNVQKELSENLSIKLYENKIELLKRFYGTANRCPQYIQSYFEEDGTKVSSDGSLINRFLNNNLKNVLIK
ncbi:MAG: hypothetical protein LBJ88_00165 [Campylobacteraceae bacterium]|nr:hypothetical protein [Campylobacteraceae bacterium]